MLGSMKLPTAYNEMLEVLHQSYYNNSSLNTIIE